jgi:hypothetical protein
MADKQQMPTHVRLLSFASGVTVGPKTQGKIDELKALAAHFQDERMECETAEDYRIMLASHEAILAEKAEAMGFK